MPLIPAPCKNLAQPLLGVFDRNLVAYQDEIYEKRLKEERKTNVYYLPITTRDGRNHYSYIVVSALLHEQFVKAVEMNQVPDYAVVVERGFGEPTDQVKKKMKDFYGFDHAMHEQQVTERREKLAAGG